MTTVLVVAALVGAFTSGDLLVASAVLAGLAGLSLIAIVIFNWWHYLGTTRMEIALHERDIVLQRFVVDLIMAEASSESRERMVHLLLTSFREPGLVVGPDGAPLRETIKQFDLEVPTQEEYARMVRAARTSQGQGTVASVFGGLLGLIVAAIVIALASSLPSTVAIGLAAIGVVALAAAVITYYFVSHRAVNFDDIDRDLEILGQAIGQVRHR